MGLFAKGYCPHCRIPFVYYRKAHSGIFSQCPRCGCPGPLPSDYRKKAYEQWGKQKIRQKEREERRKQRLFPQGEPELCFFCGAVLKYKAGSGFYRKCSHFGLCVYCLSNPGNSIDHVIPQDLGGGDYDNIVRCCRRCNSRKGSNLPEPNSSWLGNDHILDIAIREANRLMRKGDFPTKATVWQEYISQLEEVKRKRAKPVQTAMAI